METLNGSRPTTLYSSSICSSIQKLSFTPVWTKLDLEDALLTTQNQNEFPGVDQMFKMGVFSPQRTAYIKLK